MRMVVLGGRNLLRNKLRLLVVTFLIGFPFFLLLSFQAIGAAVRTYTEALKQGVDTSLQLRAKGSMGHVNMVGSHRLLPHEALEKVRGIEHVAKVEPYLLGMSPTEGHNFAMHVGLDPGDAKRLESHGEAGNPRIIAGRDFSPEDAGKDVALIGQAYARWAGISSEDLDNARFVVDLTRSHPVIFPLDRPKRELKIIGIYASGYVFGDMQLFMPMETFRRIYGVEKGLSWLFVTADSVDNVAFVERKIREALGDVADVIAPKGAATFASTTTKTVDRIAATVSLFAVALMVVVIFFVMLVTVRERAREIGTLKAIGASTGEIVAEFLAEAMAFSAIGGLLGMSLFRAVGWVLGGHLFTLSISPFLPAQYKDTLFASLGGVSPGIGPSAFALVLLVAVLVAWVGSGYGVWQVTRLSPLEAMKHE
ncbi:MAG TPA: FtsX-like permease family protein [Nitrospirales bacterium]|nr:FtsX-like permease family protein [Nitrospirales bacterium]